MSGIVTAMAAAVLLGTACGLLGTLVVVRRMALTGDMLSHAVLPGVVTGLALSPERNPLVVLMCAVAAGLAGSSVMTSIRKFTKLKPDAALALVLSVFFALGIALISRAQPAGVNAFLYGQIAALDRHDLWMLCGVSVTTLVVMLSLFRVMGLLAFDPSFARLVGLRVSWLDWIFHGLLSVVIVVAMQAVGVVLVTAMLVTPAAAARFCTGSLRIMAITACGFGAMGGALGVFVSARFSALPTGPLIAISLTTLFLMAMLAGPRCGWLVTRSRQRRESLRILGEDILKKLWLSEEAAGGPVDLSDGEFHMGKRSRLKQSLRMLRDDAMVRESGFKVRLTSSGRQRAAVLVRAHRLWEKYLTERVGLKPDHVHDSAERAEHWLDEAGRLELGEKLGHPLVDPHGSRIPSEPSSEPIKD